MIYPNDLIRLLGEYVNYNKMKKIFELFRIEIRKYKIEAKVELKNQYTLTNIASLISEENRDKYVIIDSINSFPEPRCYLSVVKTLKDIIKIIKRRSELFYGDIKNKYTSTVMLDEYIEWRQYCNGESIHIKIFGVRRKKYTRIFKKIKELTEQKN